LKKGEKGQSKNRNWRSSTVGDQEYEKKKKGTKKGGKINKKKKKK